ncbi:MAG: type I glutamate--ammonia ligase [Blastocatellia bacterium AA13]|nr:MAG: type I glutamate--ammonia ligase [Blastocatellia bacterium AA13]
MDPKTVLRYAVDEQVKFVDLRFTDLPGSWHHLTIPINQFKEDAFDSGIGFDASSLRGWASINESDMLLIPDAERFWRDTFYEEPTLCIFANVVDPITKEGYEFDPRLVAARAESYLRFTGIADVCYFGPEAEFFVFDHVSYHNEVNSAGYRFESSEGMWNTGQNDTGVSYRVRTKEGYVPVPPVDSLQDLRSDIVQNLQSVGLMPEMHHHEVASGGQCEIDFRFSNLLSTADNVMLFKYVVKNTAFYYGKAATFMPKPMFGDNGSGMHCHQSLWKGDSPLFSGDGYAGLSQLGLNYAGGILKHAAAIAAFAAPTTNSYKRLVPGYEAPVNLAYSRRNRSAAIRIPMYSQSPSAKRLEVRFPDPSCNPYLAFAAMLMAGLDGIQNSIDPGQPLDKDIYDLSPEELGSVPTLPGSLDRALEALEQDHAFLLKGNVFTEPLIERWIAYKRQHEVDQVRLRPTPLEFALYFDV